MSPSFTGETSGVQRGALYPLRLTNKTVGQGPLSDRPTVPLAALGAGLSVRLCYERVTVYWPQAVKSIVTVICCVSVPFIRVTCTCSVPASNLGRTVQAAL